MRDLLTTDHANCGSAGRALLDLPVFRLDGGTKSVLYAPGHAVVVERADVEQVLGYLRQPVSQANEPAEVGQLRDAAKNAVTAWERLSSLDYRPTCLTVYFSNHCNLGCRYCYSAELDRRRPQPRASLLEVQAPAPEMPVIDDQAVLAAASLVAAHCKSAGQPFHLVLHGGGEPTLHWDLLQRVVLSTQRIVEEHGIAWWGYIATHGVVAEEKAAWLAEHFDLIGLSCDGPPEIQDRQRPSLTGGLTSAKVLRTAQVLNERGAAVCIRTTITPETVTRQCELVDYFVNTLSATDLRFEPVYRSRNGSQATFTPDDADQFVTEFLAAQSYAQMLGCSLSISGVRLDEIHGPYCNPLRQVLQLTPDGQATACFLCTDGRRGDDAEFVIGSLDKRSGQFVLDDKRIAEVTRRATAIPDRCTDCVNKYHCVRECTDVCPVVNDERQLPREAGFKCLVQLSLTEAWLQQALQSPACV